MNVFPGTLLKIKVEVLVDAGGDGKQGWPYLHMIQKHFIPLVIFSSVLPRKKIHFSIINNK